jgi:DNA polymerase elongation subunit (family B)
MDALVIDIETVGESWDNFDEQTQHVLTDRIAKTNPDLSDDELTEKAGSDAGLTPFTGEIVALGALDCQTNKGAVYYTAPGEENEDSEDSGIKLKQSKNEKDLLERFWELSTHYSCFVTFNGRTFDMPYIMLRSAIHGIRPKKDLMKNRYLNYQSANAVHIDLFDQLNFYGSFRNLGGLHLACRAFGIETPKDGAIDGSKVGEYYHAKRYLEIARYNGRDLFATKALYEHWQKLLAF